MNRDELLPVYQEALPRIRARVRKYMGYGSPDIDDVLQDVFLQAWLHCDTLREDGRCAGWLMRIAVNTCMTYLRRSGRDIPCDMLVADETDDTYSRMMTRLMLEHAMARLSPAAKQVVWLHDLEGYPLREVAHRVRKPESTVRSSLYRARIMMRRSHPELQSPWYLGFTFAQQTQNKEAA